MKVNLGSGFKRIEGFVNVDDDPLVEPDYIVNVEKDKLPFDDNSVEEIRAHHILEHIGDGFIPLMKDYAETVGFTYEGAFYYEANTPRPYYVWVKP